MFGFSFSSFGWIFIGVLLFVVFGVLVFSESYSNTEVFSRGFYILLFVFIFSIIIFVFGVSWLVVFFGWECLGASSLLLIVFFNTNYSVSSTLKTSIVNRIGDVFLLVRGVLFFVLGWGMLLLGLASISAIVKSAQFPFFSWLPSAIAAPTPVSSLVHSSTLVTAGVWLVFSSGITRFFLLLIGGISSFVGAYIAIFEIDTKKAVAFSTLSQLGFMFLCCGSIIPSISAFYLYCHAFFKRLLFIGAGYLIYTSHNQNFSVFGTGLGTMIKLFLVSSLFCISGFHFFSGFFLKHEISLFVSEVGEIYWGIFFCLCLLTCLYCIRLFWRVFFLSVFCICFKRSILVVLLITLSASSGRFYVRGGRVTSVSGWLLGVVLVLRGCIFFTLTESGFFLVMFLSSLLISFFWGSGFVCSVRFSDESFFGGVLFLVGCLISGVEAYISILLGLLALLCI